jgi:uncharacterized protein YqeY
MSWPEAFIGVGGFFAAAYNSAEKATKTALNESDTIALIKRQIKQREDSIKQYLDAGRKDLADIEIELDYFKTHLPEMVSREELETEIKAFIAQSKITGKIAIGLTMKHLKEKWGATFDGKTASEIINKLLEP